MKKVFIKISALSLTVMVLATSCKKTAGPAGATGATGATGPNLTGNLQGVVSLYDVSGAKMLSTTLQAGDSLVLTNNSTGAVLKTVTNANGDYLFSNISTGTYSITVSKPSNGTMAFGNVITQGIQFSGGGNADRNFALSVVPTTSVNFIASTDTSFTSNGAGNVAQNYVKVRGGVPVSAGGTTVILFASIPGASTVSSAVGNYSAAYTTTIAAGVNKFTINIPTANLYDLGFTTGNTVNFAAYILGGNTAASSYVDWTTGETVYTALSSTPMNISASVQ
ncbi:MAG TPA: carboxypeptidase-like regulatory domain-containing protein [Bacteroidia bacterium]|jgi:hypothetical protein|nr:carboxypeptidase-like regulatory domain-containing protein [Bacteroidia bacterium]